jgi:elongation factor P
MATYDTSDIRRGLKVMMDGSPWTVVEFQFVKPGKGAAFTRTKFKNLLSGNVVERNIRSGEKLESADVEMKTMQYLYKDGESYVFMDTSTYDQVSIPGETIGDDALLMPEQINVEVLFYDGRAVGVTLPNFIEQKIIETDPGFRGDTATGTTKPAKIATGASINVPLFINVGDTIKIDTRTGAYLERVGRA